ncbi:hypothetical protein Phi10:1_gp052 [Cellulophaga phage phi10:1]|uniref:Uncharacterized protein n=1 Tax=Cellulophaga phage phi10:1 TaxID=1327981 RepID=S0A2E9_9CAUD|nr:hypothetical protein Phi10:1_gp052 [Cellulophaga phage phi10:1]AGO48393.1 hypothetical protein Phi10:1_gp052 [Cellulophaga phage phi10:1]
MELTGKCKEEFEKWFLLNNGHISLSDRFYNEFIELPISFKFGVFQQYFDSVKIGVESCASIYFKGFYSLVNGDESYIFNTRPEALEEAIEKANELRNKQLNK